MCVHVESCTYANALTELTCQKDDSPSHNIPVDDVEYPAILAVRLTSDQSYHRLKCRETWTIMYSLFLFPSPFPLHLTPSLFIPFLLSPPHSFPLYPTPSCSIPLLPSLPTPPLSTSPFPLHLLLSHSSPLSPYHHLQ